MIVVTRTPYGPVCHIYRDGVMIARNSARGVGAEQVLQVWALAWLAEQAAINAARSKPLFLRDVMAVTP